MLADLLAVFGDDPGCTGPRPRPGWPQAFPGRWDGATADALSAEVRARGVPSVLVKAAGQPARGCRRADIHKAAAR